MIYRLNDAYFVRAMKESDLAGAYPTWFEDQDVCRDNSHGKFFKTLAYFNDYFQQLNNSDRLVWAICHEASGHIGNICLQEISFINRTAEFAILLGDKQHWKKGVGLLADKKLLEHGFNKLNLERVYCGTAATNEGMIRLAEVLGMVQEGTRRQHLFLNGKWVDLLEFGLLRSEYGLKI